MYAPVLIYRQASNGNSRLSSYWLKFYRDSSSLIIIVTVIFENITCFIKINPYFYRLKDCVHFIAMHKKIPFTSICKNYFYRYSSLFTLRPSVKSGAGNWVVVVSLLYIIIVFRVLLNLYIIQQVLHFVI